MSTMAEMTSGLCHLKIGICLNIEDDEEISDQDFSFRGDNTFINHVSYCRENSAKVIYS